MQRLNLRNPEISCDSQYVVKSEKVRTWSALFSIEILRSHYINGLIVEEDTFVPILPELYLQIFLLPFPKILRFIRIKRLATLTVR